MGLIKYILIILFVIPFPIVLFYTAFGLYEIEPIKSFADKIPLNWLTILIFGGIQIYIIACLIVYYFILPIKTTIKVLENHWSKYLDFILNNIFIMTVILFFFLCIPYISNQLPFLDNPYIFFAFVYATPVYFLVYITAVIIKIKNSKLFKN